MTVERVKKKRLRVGGYRAAADFRTQNKLRCFHEKKKHTDTSERAEAAAEIQEKKEKKKKKRNQSENQL